MINFENITKESLRRGMLQQVPNDYDKRETSIINTALSPFATELYNLYQLLAINQDDAYFITAEGLALDYLSMMRGISRRPATPSQRMMEFNIEIPKGSRFGTIDGENSVIFKTDAKATLNIETGLFEAIATCETAGTIGNNYIGEVLPIVNVDGLETASVGEVEIAGADTETDTSLRTRFLNSFINQEFAGNIPSYRTYALSIDGVGAVQVYPHWQGGGTVKLSILDSVYDVASETLIENVQNIICPPETGSNIPSELGFGKAPIGAKVTIGTAEEVSIDLEFDVTLTQGSTVSTIRTQVEELYNEYLLSVRETWGNALITNKVEYPVSVYIARLTAKLLTISEILNITNMKLNGEEADINLTETAETNQIPVIGTITINQV